jgi:hypothetical protein
MQCLDLTVKIPHILLSLLTSLFVYILINNVTTEPVLWKSHRYNLCCVQSSDWSVIFVCCTLFNPINGYKEASSECEFFRTELNKEAPFSCKLEYYKRSTFWLLTEVQNCTEVWLQIKLKAFTWRFQVNKCIELCSTLIQVHTLVCRLLLGLFNASDIPSTIHLVFKKSFPPVWKND